MVFKSQCFKVKGRLGLTLVISLFLGAPLSFGQVLYEGYSKIVYEGKPVGFSVQQVKFHPDKKEFSSIYLVKYNEVFHDMTESLKAYAGEGLEPLRYTYKLTSREKTKSIEGLVKEGRLALTIKEASASKPAKTKIETRSLAVPSGAFFSAFWGYALLRSSQGLKINHHYDYQAIAEENGSIFSGVARVLSEETFKTRPVLKIQNDFPFVAGRPQDSFVTFATIKMEPLMTVAPQKNMTIELMENPQEAMRGIGFSLDNIKALFGEIPEGRINGLPSFISDLKNQERRGLPANVQVQKNKMRPEVASQKEASKGTKKNQ